MEPENLATDGYKGSDHNLDGENLAGTRGSGHHASDSMGNMMKKTVSSSDNQMRRSTGKKLSNVNDMTDRDNMSFMLQTKIKTKAKEGHKPTNASVTGKPPRPHQQQTVEFSQSAIQTRPFVYNGIPQNSTTDMRT